MKVNICDVCMKDGKFTKSVVRYVYTHSVARINLCEEHRRIRPTKLETIEIANAAALKFNEM